MPNNRDKPQKHLEPLFALTMGDPAGIGPEIAIKAFQNHHFRDSVFIIGEHDILTATARYCAIDQPIHPITSVSDFRTGSINIFDCKQLPYNTFKAGIAQGKCGNAAYFYIVKAIDLALLGEIDGVITNPINKKALSMGGINYPGHTEIFAEKTGCTTFSMLFMLNNVAVAHVTTHCSLRNAIDAITTEHVLQTIRLLNNSLLLLSSQKPQIAVGGLNPHAGENGLFGHEEIEHIIPAIEQARNEGINVSGPYPPDTVFMRAFKGEFNGIVSMVHDHGFVALKTLDFLHGVNITIGLPIIRTSVGHGTAFAIAGKGIASPKSLLAAHDAAIHLFNGRKRLTQ